MTTDRTNQTITLKDGYTLGYAEYGDPGGKPVFHFHGSSGSRLEHPADESILHTQGVRLITIDRPGHGLSDFQPKRQLLDWPDDVTALADHLAIEKFAVTGWSFGGPYAMVCAYKIPDRLTAVGVISSFAPYDRPNALEGVSGFNKMSLRMARWLPFWLGRQVMKMQGRAITEDPEGAARQMLSSLPEADQEVLSDPQVVGALLPSMKEAYHSGADGPAWEGAIMVRPWGFRLQEISIQVQIWHGEADVMNPVQFGEYLRDTIPNNKATFLPGEGHFFILQRWGQILAQLVE
jgi:pimeloyl-ACP methyl ester carboxylesterase